MCCTAVAIAAVQLASVLVSTHSSQHAPGTAALLCYSIDTESGMSYLPCRWIEASLTSRVSRKLDREQTNPRAPLAAGTDRQSTTYLGFAVVGRE
jgi:hypothetical protein